MLVGRGWRAVHARDCVTHEGPGAAAPAGGVELGVLPERAHTMPANDVIPRMLTKCNRAQNEERDFCVAANLLAARLMDQAQQLSKAPSQEHGDGKQPQLQLQHPWHRHSTLLSYFIHMYGGCLACLAALSRYCGWGQRHA